MRARTAECVRRADVALLLLDGAVGATGDDADVGPLLVSATHGDGLPDLLDALRGFGAVANSAHDDGDAAPAVRVALVGRPNARRRARRRFFPSHPAATPLTRGIASRRRASRRCSTRS